MKWQRKRLVGRQAELETLHEHSRKPALLVVRGPEGSGKTALLHRFRAESGAAIVDLGAGADAGQVWDEFRARALLAAVRAGFETFGAGPRVAESIDALNRLCVPESYATAGRRHRLLSAIGALLSRIRTRLVIVIDDADELPVSALAPMHRAGHTVVAACGIAGSRELCSLADRIVNLAPLTEAEIGRLLWQVAGTPVDDAVPRALRENLGPLYGNVGTLVSTVESMWDQCRLGKVHGVLAMRAPRAPIPLPAGHRLLGKIDELGRVLVRLAAADSGLRVDQIAALAQHTGPSVHDYGRTADQLVRAGVLEQSGGRLHCHARAIADAVAEPEAQSARVGRSRSDSVRQIMSAGDYERLAAVVVAKIQDSGGVVDNENERDELAAAAALAAIHTGHPVPECVRHVLDGPAFVLVDRWFAGAELDVENVAKSLGRFRGPLRGVDGHADSRDLVPVLRAVIGPLYRPPTEGPVAAYHRVCRGYADGDWADALSAARELEFMADADIPVIDAARLLAAEICGWRGENRQALAWLAAVGEDTLFPGLRGWVATGLQDDSDDGLAYGWAWYTTHSTRLEEPGAARLLVRLASIAVDLAEWHRARTILREVQGRYGPKSVTGLLVRGIVEGNDQYVRAAEGGIRTQGTRFEFVLTCQRLARLSHQPRPWLDEAYEHARSIGAARLISTTKRTMAGCGVTVPARRTLRSELSDMDDRVVGLIRSGKTNRQIALAVGVSEKTVEKHLTRLFAKAGCRTRHELATSDLGARVFDRC